MLHFVSIVSEDFWPGFGALIQSIAENSQLKIGEYRFTVICDPAKAPNSWIESRLETIHLIPQAELPRFPILTPQLQGKRMEEALQKLSLFQLDEKSGPYVYIDADMICLSSLRQALDYHPIAAASDHFFWESTDDADLRKTAHIYPPNREINTGFLIFNTGGDIFDQLLNTYKINHKKFNQKGDQDVVNAWLVGQPFTILDSSWNFSKRYLNSMGKKWFSKNEHKIRLLHFVATKPWSANSGIQNVTECRYRRLEKLWWPYFKRSGIQQDLASQFTELSSISRSYILPYIRKDFLLQRSHEMKKLARDQTRRLFARMPKLREFVKRRISNVENWSTYPSVSELARRQADKAAKTLFTDHTVQTGPFRGLQYPSLASHGSAIYSKLLGVYEAELHEILEKIIATKPSCVIDIGCAEGYYAIGMARRLPDARILASDTSISARQLCYQMAEKNEVGARVEIIGESNSETISSTALGKRGVLICDCEGAEADLLNENTFESLREWAIIVELHEFVVPGIEECLITRASKTHKTHIIESIDDYRRIDQFPLESLSSLAREIQYHLYREGRPHTMRWLVALP